MELTGKAKEEFEKWLFTKINRNIFTAKDYGSISIVDVWKQIPNSMQWGVYVDFFDSEEIFISIDFRGYGSKGFVYDTTILNFFDGDNEISLMRLSKHEAREAAIKKAVEIYNNRNDER